MQDLSQAMKRTNRLLRAQMADVQRLAGNGSSERLLRSKIDKLWQYGLDEIDVGTEVLEGIAEFVKHLSPRSGEKVRACPPRRMRQRSGT